MGQFIIFIVFVVISVVRAISKAANEQAAKQPREIRKADPDRRRRVQSEIESFLNEVTGGKGGDAAAQQKREAAERRARRERAQRKQQEKEERRRRQVAASKEAEQRNSKRAFGSDISDHVDSYINKHVAEYVDNDIEEYVEATIVDSVEEHLGDRPTRVPDKPAGSKAAQEVIQLLRDPKGVRNAILVNEILTKPRALRR